MKNYFIEENAEYYSFIAENPVFSLLRHKIGVTVCTGDDYERPPVPESVSRYQMDSALAIKQIIVSGYVADAENVERNNIEVQNTLSEKGFGEHEIDELFILAAMQ